MVRANPFKLFPAQVETAELWQYASPGLPPKILATLTVILKRATGSDAPTYDYDTRTKTRRMHVKTDTLPDDMRNDPDTLLSHVIKTREGRAYLITEVSRGDDMTTGVTEFITLTLKPYGRA